MRKSIVIFSSLLLTTGVDAGSKRVVECRLAASTTTECKTYTSKFLFSKHSPHYKNYKDLIVSKTLPVPVKPRMKVISVEDMIEEHLEILDPIRYSGRLTDSKIEQKKIEAEKERALAEEKEAQEREKKLEEEVRKQKEILVKVMEELKKRKQALQKRKAKITEKKRVAKKQEKTYAEYKVQKGDSLILIAKRFKIKTAELRRVNNMGSKSIIRIGQKLTIPLSQKKVDLIVQKRAKSLALRDKLYSGKKKQMKYSIGNKRYRHRLRVQATAYTSHREQTNKTPFLAAWNNRIRPGMKVIAVSRDLISKYGLGNGKRVRIQGLPGIYTVRDKMNKRLRRHIDIYMGTDRRKALRWGRRRVVLLW